MTAGFTGNTGSFTGNIGEAASGFGARVSQTASGFTEGVKSGSLGGFKDSFFSDFVPTPGSEVAKVTESATSLTTQPIQQGDTLSQIAQANNTTVDALMAANPNITDPNMIIAGESINIPQVSAGGASGGTKLVDSVVDTGANAAGEVTGEVAERNFLEKQATICSVVDKALNR